MLQGQASAFELVVPGKWILAGEHSVLRGSEALVFPLPSRYLKLNYTPGPQDLELVLIGQNSAELELIIWSVLERAFTVLGIKRREMTGRVQLESHIALGGGTGASATLCVTITEWLHRLGYVADKDRFDFARGLENLFHGESRGVDVAVTLFQKPLVFTRNSGFSELRAKADVNLYLSYSGQRGVTKDCVEQVKTLFEKDPSAAKAIDEKMAESVRQLKTLLTEGGTLIEWIKVVKKANSCFEDWGLLSESVKKHQNALLQAGALAVKLTGSGGGGYVLSLWESKPPGNLPFEMIRCFN